MKRTKIYTDGGCDKNPGGRGAWAFRIIDEENIVEQSGRVEKTTNNRMELTAAIRALEWLKEPTTVELFTDSQYLSRGMTEWLGGWVRRNWTLKDGSPVKNVDLWKRLYELDRKHNVTWTWIQGHAGDIHNTRVDQLVQRALKGKTANGKPSSEPPGAVAPEVKLVKQKGKPVAVSIALKSVRSSQPDTGFSIRFEAAHLQKLIEDLIAVLRQIQGS